MEATGNQYDVVGFLHLCCCCTLGFAATCGIVKSLTHFFFLALLFGCELPEKSEGKKKKLIPFILITTFSISTVANISGIMKETAPTAHILHMAAAAVTTL